MTVADYLSELSLGYRLGSPVQLSPKTIRRRQEWAHAMTQAELDVLAIANRHASSPFNHRESRENAAGVMLAVGTMLTNYVAHFPLIVTRHRLQVYSTPWSWRRDTPFYCLRVVAKTYQNGGLRSLFAGFDVGLVGQVVGSIYESVVSESISSIQYPSKTTQQVVRSLCQCMSTLILIPLYPLYRNAWIRRVQPQSYRLVHGGSIWRAYWHDLQRFFHRRTPDHPGALPLYSMFVPWSIASFASEWVFIRLNQRLYRFILRRLSLPTRNEEKSSPSSSRWRRRRHRKKLQSLTFLHTFYPEITCSIVSAVIGRALSYPVDTVLFKLMLQDSGMAGTQVLYTGFWDCASQLWHQGGVGAFFPGWGAHVLECVLAYTLLELSWAGYRGVRHGLEWAYRAPSHLHFSHRHHSLRR